MAVNVKKVAIIGGGVSGLACASRLNELGISNTVFDTGRAHAGGRVSSRMVTIGDQSVVVDHSAQMLMVNDERLRQHCLDNEPLISTWNGTIASLKSDSPYTLIDAVPPRFVGRYGMRSFSESLSSGVDVRVKRWVSRLERKDVPSSADGSGSATWSLYEHGSMLGSFDAVVIAHNGKCADRLLSSASVPRIHDVLKVSFGAALPQQLNNMRKMQLCSLFIMTIVVTKPLDKVPYDAAYVEDKDKVLSWICNTNAKLGIASPYESWTLMSTREYAAANKVPQEAIPKDKEDLVKSDMLRSFIALTGISVDAKDIVYSKIQLWGAAVPLNRHSAPFVLDGEKRVGVCGDWFTSSSHSKGPSIESAYCSGRALAEKLAAGMTSSDGRLTDVGLDGAQFFEACDHLHPLGDVPGHVTAARVNTKGPPLDTSGSIVSSSGPGSAVRTTGEAGKSSTFKRYTPKKKPTNAKA